MKKVIVYIIFVILLIISFGFRIQNDPNINKTLLCKTWQTSAKDDKNSKVIITFNSDNSYSHEYFTENMPKKEKMIMHGKWTIVGNKKIHITFGTSKTKDDFDIISIKENELILHTINGIKKFEQTTKTSDTKQPK